MRLTGRCYCGRVQFQADGDPMVSAQCYCRECQFISGGAPNNFVAMPVGGFAYTAGAPKAFARDDLPDPATREFCAECGTHLTTRNKSWPFVVVKVGALDDPAQFQPQIAMQVADKQPFHNIPEHVKQFERWPPM